MNIFGLVEKQRLEIESLRTKPQPTPSQSEPVALTIVEQGVMREALLKSVNIIHPREQPSQSDEAFKESVSDLRKYSYEFSHSKDMETYDLMIAAQVNLHKLFDAERAKLAEHEQPTPSQSEPVGWWREGNDLDESDYYPAEHFPDLDTTGCIPLYTKPQPTSQDVLDAELYRTLKKLLGYQLSGYDDIGNFFVSKKIRAGEERFLYGEKLDSALTAAMKESK